MTKIKIDESLCLGQPQLLTPLPAMDLVVLVNVLVPAGATPIMPWRIVANAAGP